MILGVAYYPEHWPHERWEIDARLMQEAGITRVRMAEFAWHRMEPREGQFEFGWLEEAINLFGRYGIETILGTPTPTYPAWLHDMYPDIHQIKSNGQVKEWGQRQDACKNHLGYRAYARRIVERMTAALGDNPHVVAWQTDNEFGCHGTAALPLPQLRAGVPLMAAPALRQRYRQPERRLGHGLLEPGVRRLRPDLAADGHRRPHGQRRPESEPGGRFLSLLIRCADRDQSRAGRDHPSQLAGPAGHPQPDGPLPPDRLLRLAADLDIVSWDNYPFGMNGTNRPPQPLPHDLMRGLKQKNVWVMEQGSGAGGWGSYPATPQPGQMRLWAYQAVARGADMISFFRWRSCRWGREQYWHGILYHHGIPQRRYDEAKQLGAEFKALSAELDGSEVTRRGRHPLRLRQPVGAGDAAEYRRRLRLPGDGRRLGCRARPPGRRGGCGQRRCRPLPLQSAHRTECSHLPAGHRRAAGRLRPQMAAR